MKRSYIIEVRDWDHRVVTRCGVYAFDKEDATVVARNLIRLCEWRYSCDPKYLRARVWEDPTE